MTEKIRLFGNILIVGACLGLLYQFGPFALARFQYRQFQRTVNAPVEIGYSDYTDEFVPFDEADTTSKAATPEAVVTVITSPVSSEPTLLIPKLSITVPIVLNVDVSRQYIYNMALKNGVGHMKGTAPLEAETGNSFIFGHSSRFTSTGTPYDTIFANLDFLTVGDELTMLVGGRSRIFRVTTSQAISPNNLTFLKKSEERIVTLMTCWPAGLPLKRWIVQAKEI